MTKKIGDSSNFHKLYSRGNYLYWISLYFEGDDDDEPNLSISDENEIGAIDISTPDNPQKIDTFDTGLDSAYTMKGNAQVFFSQNRPYIYYEKIKKGSTYISGLEVIDLSDPQNLNQSSFGEIYWPNNSVPSVDITLKNEDNYIIFKPKPGAFTELPGACGPLQPVS